jgi:hypothetical protein
VSLEIRRRRPPDGLFVPIEQRLPVRQHAYAKCLPGYGARDGIGCGGTLMTYLDWQLHVCDQRATQRQAMRGFRDDRVVEM